MIAELLTTLNGKSAEFKLFAVQDMPRNVVYVQASEYKRFIDGTADTLTVRLDARFPFLMPMELVP